jgi:hypothetical protein
MTPTDGALLMMGLIALIVSVVVLLDWLARRKDRQSQAPRA